MTLQTSFTSWNSPSDPQAASMPMLGPAPVFRNAKDARLASFGQSPDTQHPDGYLGTIVNRRQDKILGAVDRNNQRSYSRGVHKGERINQGDYIWPKNFNLLTGIMLESKGKRYAPVGAEPARLTNDGKAGPRGIPRSLDRPQVEQINEMRRAQLVHLKPMWR